MKNSILILTSLFTILFSCSSNHKEEAVSDKMLVVSDEAVANQVYEVVSSPAPSDGKSIENRLETSTLISVNKQKLIKDGSITIKSQDINASKKGFDNLLKQLNAYYETEDLQNNEQTISYILKIRIPAANFEQLLTSIENGKDEITLKNIQTRDVTEEYVDIETRLTTKREYLLRYKQILAKAATVKDILAIQENIRTLEEEIDSQQGRLKYLADQVAFSTLNINLYKDKEYIQQPQRGFLTRTKVALNNGWQSIVDFVLWALSIWPYFIIVFGSYFIIKRIVKIRRERRKSNENN